MFVATLNHTVKSFALANSAPNTSSAGCRAAPTNGTSSSCLTNSSSPSSRADLRIIGETGVIYNVFADRWQLSADMDVNYMVVAEKGCVMATPWLWAVFTVIAAFAQTLRNAMQRELTREPRHRWRAKLHVRFLFGFPFVLLFCVGVTHRDTARRCRRPGWSFWPWVLDGAFAQVAATALMLAAMGERSFVVTIAYIKTEPIQVAVFGLIFLGDA